MKNLTSKSWLLILIMAVAAIARFYQFSSWSLTNDELSALLGFSYGSLSNNVFIYVANDFHPAGVQILIWFWCKIFGTSVIALRLPFVLMGIVTVYLVYLIARKWFNYYAGVLIAATLAVSQFAILYSQIARPYSAGLFFVMLALYGWNGFVFLEKSQKPKFSNLLFFVIGMILSMYNHYFSFLMVAIIGVSGLLMVSKMNRKMYVMCGITAIILFLPHLKLTIKQFSAGGLGWLAAPDSDYFKIYTKYMFNQSKWYFLFIIAIAIIAAIKLPFKLPENKLKWLALLWFLFPLLIAYFYSIYVSPVLQHSILIFSYPFILFFIFSLTPNNQKSVVVLVPIILIVGVIQVYGINKFNGSNEFARFKEIAEHIDQADQKYGALNITRAINITDSSYIGYYLSKLNNHHPFAFYHNAGREELKKVMKLVNESKTTYFMYAWSNSDCPPEINQIIQEKYPYLIEKEHYFNSEYYLYSNIKSDSVRQIKTIEQKFIQNYDSLSTAFSIPASTDLDTISVNLINKFELMTDKNEFSSTFSKPLNVIINNSANIIHVSALIKSLNKDDDALIVFSINHGNENYFWSGLNLKSFLSHQGEWTRCYYSIRLPEIKSAEDQITIYIYNQNKKNFYIDDFNIKVEQGNANLYGPRSDQYLFSQKL
jgi:uncharacterized membrane protein